jgi:hypothetical protein
VSHHSCDRSAFASLPAHSVALVIVLLLDPICADNHPWCRLIDAKEKGLKKATETVIVLLACIPALLTALMVVPGPTLELIAPEWAVAWHSFTAPLRALFRVLS